MNKRVVLLLASTFFSSAAALAGVTALGKLVYDITGRELLLGFLGLAEFMPALLLVLITGAVADRFDRRRVAAIAGMGEAMVALGIAAYVATEPTAVAPIFLLVLLFGITRAFVAPASRALPADIVEPSRLPWLVARHSAMWQASIIVGPVFGGVLYAIEPAYAFVGMSGLLVIGAVCIASIPLAVGDDVVVDEPLVEAAVEPVLGHFVDVQEPGPSGRLSGRRETFREALEGLKLIRTNPILLGAISLDLFAVLFGGAVALLPAIAEDRLGVGAVGLGWLRAAGGIGAAMVTVVLAVHPFRRNVGRILLAAVAVFGAVTIVLGLTHSFAVAFVALAVLSGADSVSVYVRATLVPLMTPPDMRGRVLAVENVFIGASNELGAFESGVAGELIGASGAIVLGGAATLAVALTWWLAFPALKGVDRFPQS